MDETARAENLQAGVDRAHSFRSPGHWDATTRDLYTGWHSANRKVREAGTPTAVFRASLDRELCAMVLRDRGKMPGA